MPASPGRGPLGPESCQPRPQAVHPQRRGLPGVPPSRCPASSRISRVLTPEAALRGLCGPHASPCGSAGQRKMGTGRRRPRRQAVPEQLSEAPPRASLSPTGKGRTKGTAPGGCPVSALAPSRLRPASSPRPDPRPPPPPSESSLRRPPGSLWPGRRLFRPQGSCPGLRAKHPGPGGPPPASPGSG